ncbi:ABC transporter permease [Pelomicrobium methylotrophicum]|uniref:ABC transporter permease n=1 Tax=Pelomicrobium methylotrophicum TaxID=2602750 RepID=A0A5C7EGW7_9PROT|nr:ABC transporter permease [Pelomicrobium methylotrophicum]TXF11240.1 ABC transporter permease [Pelomicrobium methylotrophicum]
MAFKVEILYTDALVFVLLAVVVAFAWIARRHEHLRLPWRRVAGSRSGMAAATVLAFYVFIGLLDTLHYRPALPSEPGKPPVYSAEVLSVLDWIAEPLRTRKEKTYSAPFATHLYAKETIELPDGRQVRDFPRLKYGGAHLADPVRDRAADIAARAAKGWLGAVLVWLAAASLITLGVARRRGVGIVGGWRALWRGETVVQWNAVLVTLAVILAVAGPVASLCTYYHVLGTDKVGQDVLYLSLKSIRTGLVIGTLTTLVMLPFALLLGIMAGYFRGWVDDVIQYVYTTLSSIPSVLLIAAAVLMVHVYIETRPELFPTITQRQDMRLLFLCLILGITSWTGLCRLLRGEALKMRELEFIQAAHAFGVADLRIITRHIVPNVMHIVLIAVVLDFSVLVLAEAVLSYIGVGVDPTMISFGTMINAARLEMAREPMVWWSLASAFFFMFLLVLAANLFADAVRDAFDPRLRMRSGVDGGVAVKGVA